MIPAPRCWVRVRVLPSRRVGVLPVRAEPSGVDANREDIAVRLVTERAAGPEDAGELAGAEAGSLRCAPSGAPHTLQ